MFQGVVVETQGAERGGSTVNNGGGLTGLWETLGDGGNFKVPRVGPYRIG